MMGSVMVDEMVWLVLSAVAGAGYVCGSVLSVVDTVRPGALESHPYVADAVPKRWRGVVLGSELVTTVLLWIGLTVTNDVTAYGVALLGYCGLLVWLFGFSFKRLEMTDRCRKVGLTVTWAVFTSAFVALAAIVTSRSTPAYAAGFVWAHAVHRLVVDGIYTLLMLRFQALEGTDSFILV